MLVLKCDACGHQFTVGCDEVFFDCISSDERQMGTESEYEAVVDTECPQCGGSVHVTLNAWEYPAGSLNHSEQKARGAEIISNDCWPI